jgi:AcrR family transcriptional regulator
MQTRTKSPSDYRNQQVEEATASLDDLRQTILDTSLELIESQGLDRLSVRAVSRLLGVSHQAPYYHFKDRQSILAALAAEGFSRLHGAMLRAASKKHLPKERLSTAGKAYVLFAISNPGYFKVMFLSEEEAGSPDRREQGDRTFQYFVSLLKEASKVSVDNDALVASSWVMVHGLAVLIGDGTLFRQIKVPRGQSTAFIDKVVSNFVELVCKT